MNRIKRLFYRTASSRVYQKRLELYFVEGSRGSLGERQTGWILHIKSFFQGYALGHIFRQLVSDNVKEV